MSVDEVKGTPTDPTRRGHRWLTYLGVVAVVVVAFVACLPWIVGNSWVLNRLLHSGLAKNEIEAEIGSAQLGWFVPAQLNRIEMKDQQNRWEMTADQASTELTLWQLIWSQGDLGEFTISGPTVIVNADRPWPQVEADASGTDQEGDRASSSEGKLRVTVEDGTVLIRTQHGEDPQEFLRGANVTVEYAQNAGQRTLVVEPGRPVEEAQLTPEMCNLGIKFIVPVLADVTWVSGAMSLELDECTIPLDHPKDARVVGRLEIRAVESGLHKGLADQIVELVARLGVGDVPESVKLAQDSIVEFRVADERVEHKDLAFGLPAVDKNLVITTNGTVGMDSTLDLVATLPPFGEWLGDGPIGQAMRSQRLTLPVSGTLEDPKVSLEGHQQIIGSLIDQVIPGINENQPLSDEEVDATLNDVGDTVGEVLDLLRERRQMRLERREANQPSTDEEDSRPGMFERMRERREQRRQNRDSRRFQNPPPPS